MIWPLLMALAATVGIACLAAGHRPQAVSAGEMLLAYAAMRAKSAVFSGSEYESAVSAAIWLAVAVAIQRQLRYVSATIPILLGAVSLCYLWARLVSAPKVIGSAPYMVADVLAILALLLIGRRSFVSLAHRVADMARDRRGRGVAGAAVSHTKVAEATPEVRPDG